MQISVWVCCSPSPAMRTCVSWTKRRSCNKPGARSLVITACASNRRPASHGQRACCRPNTEVLCVHRCRRCSSPATPTAALRSGSCSMRPLGLPSVSRLWPAAKGIPSGVTASRGCIGGSSAMGQRVNSWVRRASQYPDRRLRRSSGRSRSDRSAQTPWRGAFAFSTTGDCGGRLWFHGWASGIFWRLGDCWGGILKFADGGVKRHGESALTADQIRPLEFHPEAMPLPSNFERIRGEGDHVVAPIDLQYTFQGFIERRHYQYSSACRATDSV